VDLVAASGKFNWCLIFSIRLVCLKNGDEIEIKLIAVPAIVGTVQMSNQRTNQLKQDVTKNNK